MNIMKDVNINNSDTVNNIIIIKQEVNEFSDCNITNIKQEEVDIKEETVNADEKRRCKNLVDQILKDKFNGYSFEKQLEMKNHGRCTPKLQGLLQTDCRNKSRTFNTEWYKRIDWLTGSDIKNKLFCWNCLLFSSISSPAKVWYETGYSDLKNLSAAIRKHAATREHLSATVKLKLFGKSRINLALDEDLRYQIKVHNDKVRFNRDIMRRLIHLTTGLGKLELPFRGHNETEDSSKPGNYVGIANILKEYDETLRIQLESYNHIQNDLIESISSFVFKHIHTEILDSEFFAVQIDETTDTSCKSQVSIIIRFTKEGEAVERFLGFFDLSSGHKADDFKNLIDQQLTKFNYGEKLVAQTYDGAAVMSSEIKGLQKKVKENAPQALFVHCWAHRLNLVLEQSSGHIAESKRFFASISSFSTFFSKSPKRMHVLDLLHAQRVPRAVATHWNFASGVVFTVKEHRELLLEVFEYILNSDNFRNDKDTLSDAINLKNHLENFEFLLLLFIYNFVLSLTDITYQVLQTKQLDIADCQIRIAILLDNLRKNRSDIKFNEMFSDTIAAVGAPLRKLTDSVKNIELNFKRIYFKIVDCVIAQIEIRFKDLEKTNFYNLFAVDKFDSYTNVFPEQYFRSVFIVYGEYFDKTTLRHELQYLYSDPLIIRNAKNVTEILKNIYEGELYTCLPQVYKLLQLIVTIPTTVPAVEKGFSTLKRIKTYCGNSMDSDRFSALSAIAIEKDLVNKLEQSHEWYDNIIDHFAAMKEGRIDLVYRK